MSSANPRNLISQRPIFTLLSSSSSLFFSFNIRLIDPAVRARRRLWRLAFVFIDVDLEALAVAAILPVRQSVADTVKKRTAAQIDVADQHSAKMAEVADVVPADTEGSQELEDDHDDHEGAHAQLDRNGEHGDLAVGKKDGAGQKHSKDCSRCADCRNVRERLAPDQRNRIDHEIDQTGAHSSKEVIAQEAVAAPNDFEFAPEHPEHEHVRQNVPDRTTVVQEQVSEWLPDAEPVDYR